MTNRRILAVALAAAALAAPAAAYKRIPFDKAAFETAAQAAADAGLTGVIAVTDARREVFRLATGPQAQAKLWPWGSLSKQVTAVLAMRLIDQGKLSLDTTIAVALPDFPNSQLAGVTVHDPATTWIDLRATLDEDVELLWKAILNMFEFDRSAARGKMCMRKLVVFRHDSPLGNAPSHTLFDRIRVEPVDAGKPPRRYEDYTVTFAQEGMPGGVTAIQMP